jgi:hypothetical protein
VIRLTGNDRKKTVFRENMNNYFDSYGMLHDQPATPLNPFPCNDSLILSAIADKASGTDYFYFKAYDYFNDLNKFNGIPTDRIPNDPTPPPSRDTMLALAYFGLITPELMISRKWNFTGEELPRFNPFKTIASFILAIGEDRKFLWQHDLKHSYRLMNRVPFSDRASYYRFNSKKIPRRYVIFDMMDKILKPRDNSGMFLAYLKHDQDPPIEEWLKKFNYDENHPAIKFKRNVR